VEGKEYTIADDKGPSSLVINCKKGVFVTPAYVQNLEQGFQIFGKASFLLQTRNGSIIVAGS
jgi:3-deoxy-D-manno-octulosonic acid (KDO) 8-phosphate synthase